jgi:hypothetical protein
MPPHPFLQPLVYRFLVIFYLKLSITALKQTLAPSPPFHQIESVHEFLFWISVVLVVWFLLLGFLIICRALEGNLLGCILFQVSSSSKQKLGALSLWVLSLILQVFKKVLICLHYS